MPELHQVGCMGKIVTFKESENNMFLIELKGIIRFEIENEIQTNKKYRLCKINFNKFYDDLDEKENLKFSDLELIFKDLKDLFEKEDLLLIGKL